MKQKEALEKAAAICSGSEKCVFDINRKLKKWDVDEVTSHKILDQLIEDKFIDHHRYASFYARDKFRFNKWGKRKIEFELRQRGIETTIINEALEQISDDDYNMVLKEILEQKLKGIRNKDYYQTKAALLRFATSRGFENELVYDTVDIILESQKNN